MKSFTFELLGSLSGVTKALAGSVELAVSAICRGENYEKAEVYYISNQTRESSNWKYVLLPNSHFLTPELLADTVAFRGPTADLT